MKHLIFKSALALVIVFIFNSCGIITPQKNKNIQIIAHRGYHAEVPENTMESYRLAKEHGINSIEIDISSTKDSVPVIFHDVTMERLTGRSGSIYDYTLLEIRNIHIQDSFNIPTFEEFLAEFNDSFNPIYVEIKNIPDLQKFHELIINYNAKENIVITCFDLAVLKNLQSQDSSMHLAYDDKDYKFIDTYKTSSILPEAIDNNFEYVLSSFGKIDQAFCLLAHSNNIKVIAWTPNNMIEFSDIFKKDIDGIMTDQPILLKDAIE